jgi:GNAT superfamily N-acetyltransferase
MTSDLEIRPGHPEDAVAVSALLRALTAAGKRTRPDDVDFARDHYLTKTEGHVSVFLAVDGARVLGLQVLTRAGPDRPFGIPEGCGAIGTHVHPDAAGQGIGRALFARTLAVAKASGLSQLDAAIGETNAEGLGYYAAMGFETDRIADGRVHKVLNLT